MATNPGYTGLSRSDLRELTRERLEDAVTLLRGGRPTAAAYMCGYALEMALKACVCRRLRLNEYPPRRLTKDFKTHNFDDLLLLAGLEDEVSGKKHKSLAKWSVVARWNPEWRYSAPGSTTLKDAEDMIKVLRDEVLPWLKKRW